MLDRSVTTLLKKTSKSILLLGPRQVGKSTLVRSFPTDRIINFAEEEIFLRYSKDPGLLIREIEASTAVNLVVLDEVQRIPTILNTVQGLLDKNPKLRFILTGSSARKLKRGQANLLPGRIILQYLDPLSFWEMGSLFDLERVLQIGALPGIYLDEKEGPDVLESYATVYLREEIQAEAAAKNVGQYARFLDMAASASGEWINYSKIASDSEIPKETVRRFFTILEDTLLAFRIPSFQPHHSKRRVSQRDRFLFFDVGVRNALLRLHRSVLSPTENGKLFEHWLFCQCFYYIRAYRKPWHISSYRTDAGAEVDIILDIGNKLLAIECKYGKNVSESDLRGLRSFETIAHKPVEKYLVYRGETIQKFPTGELVLPYQDFLQKMFTW